MHQYLFIPIILVYIIHQLMSMKISIIDILQHLFVHVLIFRYLIHHSCLSNLVIIKFVQVILLKIIIGMSLFTIFGALCKMSKRTVSNQVAVFNERHLLNTHELSNSTFIVQTSILIEQFQE